jgi:hypothetical protein
MWYPSNLAEESYLEYVPEEILALWEPAALEWLHKVYQSEPCCRVRRRHIEIDTQLQDAPRGPTRRQLIEAAYQLQYGVPR